MDDFLPSDYEVPSESGYMKFQSGDNRFRILSKPVIGWEDWKDKKPLRFHIKDKPDYPIDPSKPIKHFWAMVVWDYAKKKVSILEITQKTILNTLQALIKDPDWGSPLNYDIKVSKTGSGMETEYETRPTPHSPVSPAIQESVQNINLEALFTGGDPFNSKVSKAGVKSESGEPPPEDVFGMCNREDDSQNLPC